MSGQVNRQPMPLRAVLLGGTALLVLNYFGSEARAQVQLPQVTVTGAKPKPKPAPRRVVVRPAPARAPVPVAAAPAAPSPANAAAVKNDAFDTARSNVYTTIGTTSDTLSHNLIETLPQGTNQAVERTLLQTPGVSQDSAAAGLLHVRNDHANVQFRINGVMLPDGLTGFSSILDPSLIGSMSLINGALPAEYGLRTVGLIDITTRKDIFNNSGSVSLYGGSHATFQPSFEYGGTLPSFNPCTTAPILTKAASGAAADCLPGIQYFVTGRYLQTNEGIENPLPTYKPIHDWSQQEKGFGYVSMFLDPVTRLTMMAGTSTSWFQIPNVIGAPLSPAFPNATFDSTKLNENQYENTQFGVLALQRSANGFDGQFSYFTRYDTLHFVPDPVGDLLINGIASDVTRRSFTNGLQGDGSYIINDAHTLRAGFFLSAEQSFVGNTSTVVPCMACDGTDNGPPQSITDNVSKLGWLAGVYVQDEWKITRNFTINAGLRFDQMWQYVDANQLSPRINFTWKPFPYTTFHGGYARYFTPPVQVEAAPANFALFNGTSGAVTNPLGNPVLPERSNYFDFGVTQNIPFGCSNPAAKDCTDLDLGVDAYYKQATDLIDNGQFGQALVLSAFNYAQGIVEGVEFSAKFHSGNFQAYANLALGYEKATNPISNQFLFDNATPLPDLGGLTQYQYLQTHWILTDHTQIATGSAGASYTFCDGPVSAAAFFDTWCGTRLSADMIYGTGFRDGDANIGTVPSYTQVNVGMAREFLLPHDRNPVTVRFDVVNLFDTVYQIRDGSGIGVFAAQYGPRRGFFAGVSKKFGDPPVVSAAYVPPSPRPIYKAPPGVHDWTGVYIGGNFGGAWSPLSAQNFSDTLGSSFTAGTNLQFLGGGQVGVNYQFADRFVVGAEAMVDWLPGTQLSPITATDPTGTDAATIPNVSARWVATATGRLGYAWNSVLFYGKGGGAWVGTNSPTISVDGVPASFSSVSNANGFGYTAGLGVEWAFAPDWSLRFEYDYIGLPNQTYTVAAATPTFGGDVIDFHERSLSIATAAINYKLGGR